MPSCRWPGTLYACAVIPRLSTVSSITDIAQTLQNLDLSFPLLCRLGCDTGFDSGRAAAANPHRLGASTCRHATETVVDCWLCFQVAVSGAGVSGHSICLDQAKSVHFESVGLPLTSFASVSAGCPSMSGKTHSIRCRKAILEGMQSVSADVVRLSCVQ